MDKFDLQLNWATHESAKYACLNWHYSKALPCGKLVKIGVWEFKKFIGVVLFGRGANNNMLKPFRLNQNEGCELVRIALATHKAPVSQIVSKAIHFLKKQSKGLRIIVSYADPEAGHHGGIYQAGNWLYTGLSSEAVKVFYKGKWSHKKTVDDSGISQASLPKKKVQGKHRYLMPLDDAMKKQIESLRKPYPAKNACMLEL